MKKILVVEDNEAIVKGIKYLLEQEGFKVIVALNIQEAENVIGKEELDLIILDIMLPDGSGFTLCEYIKQYTDTSVIFLTAKDDESDIVKGFDLGADDYVVKPFKARELVSRINNTFRRNNKSCSIISYKNIKINIEAKNVKVNNQEVEFTALEYKILVLLFSNIGKIVTREQILEKIWDVAGNFVNDNTLTVYIKRIRSKFGDDDIIKTVKGIGYKVQEEENEQTK